MNEKEFGVVFADAEMHQFCTRQRAAAHKTVGRSSRPTRFERQTS